ncbi:hypothetical protein Tco_0289571 [Tanacetum coccineum]
MAVLESCPKHNMVAYLEKTEGNAKFHEVIDFLTLSSIHNALTISPVVSTTFVEQFWMSAKSKIINNVRYITAKVVGKPVSISEASIRSDLLFDDADGIDSLPNQAIFDAIQLMGHLDAKKKFVMYPRFISIFLDKQLMNVPVPLDHFPVNALTSKVFSFMVKKGKHFSGKVTPLFASMLVQPTKDDGTTSERPSEPQPTPSPPHLSEATVEPQSDPSPRPSPSTHIPDSIPDVSGGNQGGQSSSDRSLSGNEGDMTLQNQEAKEESQTCYYTPQSLNEEYARKLQEDWETKEERKRLAEEEATKTALSDEYDFIQARIEADRLLALRLQDKERESSSLWKKEQSSFMIQLAAQRRFLAEQRAIAIRNKPPTRTHLRNQMMTYLKHVGNKKHLDLKSKTFGKHQALNEKSEEFYENFTALFLLRIEKGLRIIKG